MNHVLLVWCDSSSYPPVEQLIVEPGLCIAAGIVSTLSTSVVLSYVFLVVPISMRRYIWCPANLAEIVLLGAEWVDPSLFLRVRRGSMMTCRREKQQSGVVERDTFPTLGLVRRTLEPLESKRYLRGGKVNYCFFGQHSELRIRSLRSKN